MKNEISNILNQIKVGNTTKALEDAKLYYKKNTNELDAIKLLAYSYIQVGNFEKVISVLENGYKGREQKKDFDYFNNVGYALSQIEEYEESLITLNKAIAINDKNIGTHTTISEIYLKLREFKRAEEFILNAFKMILDKGEDIYDKHANVFLLISEINSALKKDSKTIKVFNEILKKKFNANIFFLLMNVDPKSIELSEASSIENRLLKSEEEFQNKIERFNYVTPLHFGLGMYYQSLDQKKSEIFFDKANKEILNNTRYNSHQYQERINKIMALYINKYKSYDENESQYGENNFFIIGSPRSGTTLVESIVTANDKVFSGGELKSCKDIIERNVLSAEQNFGGLSHQFLSKYIRRTKHLKGSCDFIVDKMPENFLYLGIILKLMPKSKILRIFRNPWDIAVSLYRQRYILNVPYSVSFFNIGIFLANFEAINLFWNNNIEKKQNVMDVKYEDLVLNFDDYQKKIYSFLGINAKYEDKIRKQFFSSTASIRQVKEGIGLKSYEKKEFMHHKAEFIDSFFMQRQYWASKEIVPENTSFFGYPIK